MQTIIQISGGISEYPFKAIDSMVLECFEKANSTIDNSKAIPFQVIMRTLECFLQVSKQTLNIVTMRSPAFAEICTSYIGAIYSLSLFDTSQIQKYKLVISFLHLTAKLEIISLAFPVSNVALSTARNTDEIQQCIFKFENIKLDEEMLWLWRGWPCMDRKGVIFWAPLYPIYERLGKEFTQQFHNVCIEYIGARIIHRAHCVKSLAKFIYQYPDQFDHKDFKSPAFMGRFWRSFLTYYLVTGYANGQGSKITTLITAWRSHFKLFVESYLIPSGLFAETWGEFPTPPARTVTGASTHIQTNDDGELVKVKLLTDIPLYVTDEEAMHLMFVQIKADVEVATQWATWAANDIWKRYQSRLEQSSQGVIVKIGINNVNNGRGWLTDRNNPDHFKNAATTLSHYGHIDVTSKSRRLFPLPMGQTIYELAMPSTGTLIPHCILLVANHPSITPSFLENLELYDKNGIKTGFIETDGSSKLIGYKRRRGSNLAQQIINLNDTTTQIVQQIIALTKSIREHLKSKGDDNWRFLLLTCKQGFSYPKRVKRLASETGPTIRVQQFANSLEKTSALSLDQRTKYAQKFNLTALRASCGVLVYLETRSLREMSKALGHAELDIKLIRRYLPESILAFFQERWIRIFQAAILVEALKDSDYLLEASGFQNIDELDIFLKTHALKLPPEPTISKVRNQIDSRQHFSEEIVFGVNSTILTLLLSLQLAVQNAQKNVNDKAKYWAEITQHLIEHLETIEHYRPDLKAYLEVAKSQSNPLKMEGLIYA